MTNLIRSISSFVLQIIRRNPFNELIKFIFIGLVVSGCSGQTVENLNKDYLKFLDSNSSISITSTDPDGSYGETAGINITLNFQKAVTLSGDLQLVFDTGNTASISSFTDSTVATAVYTVGANETSADLNITALNLTGSLKVVSSGSDVDLSLPETNLADSKNIVIDAVKPAIINVTSTTSDGSYTVGQVIPVTVQFSEPVSVTGIPQLALNTSVVNYITGTGTNTLTFEYIVASGQDTADLNYLAAASLTGTIADLVNYTPNSSALILPDNASTGSLGTNKAIVIDTTAPTVTNVTSSTANGFYGIGQTISVQMVFSEAVTVNGTPQLTLETGTSDAVVNYTSGSGTNTLTFDYTVGSGQTAADLDYVNAAALALNGSTINDGTGNTAALALAAPGAAGSLGTNKALVIDTIVPTVTNVTSSNINGSYNDGDVISIQVTFSEAVTVTGTPRLTLETGVLDAVADYTSGSGSSTLNFNYTVSGASGHNSSDLDCVSTTALALNGGTITRAAGAANAANLTLATPGAAGSLGMNKNVVIDTTLPVVLDVTSSTTDATYGNGQIILIQVVFSEIVAVTGTPQLTLETGTTDAVVDYTSGSGTSMLTFAYTVAGGQAATDLDYLSAAALALNSGTIIDTAGNAANRILSSPGAAGSLGANKNLVIDTTQPTVTNVTSSADDNNYSVGSLIQVQVEFNDVVVLTGAPQLTLETGTSDAVVNYTSGSGTNILTFNYVVASGHNSADLNYVSTAALALNGGTIKDTAGNSAILTLPALAAAGSLGLNKAIVVDTTSPAANNVTSAKTDGTYGIGETISIQVVFNEAVIVGGTPQLTLETGASDAVVNYTSGSGTNTLTFDYVVAIGQNSGDLDYVSTTGLALNGGIITDSSGNAATLTLAAPGAAGSLKANKAIVIDTTAPTVTNVTSLTANGSYNNGDPVSIQVVFSEAVTVTGIPQLTLETGTTDAVVDYTSGSGTTTLTFNYTVASGQTAADLDYANTTALALNGGTIIETAGAGNAANLTLATPGAAGSFGANKAIIIDTTLPTVMDVTSSTANGSYNNGDPVSIQVVFSEAVTVTGIPQLTLETGTTDAVVNYASGSGTATLTFNYTVSGAASHTSSDLDYLSTTALALNTGTINDTAGNASTLTLAAPGDTGSLGANKAIIVDTTIPAVTSVTSSTADGTYGLGQVIPVQVVFSEAVTVTGTPRITLETGASDAVVNYTSGSGTNTLTFDYTVVSDHDSGDLDYLNTSALVLNSGTIYDAAGNAATLTLAAPGAAGSLGASKTIIIITNVPSILSVTSLTANGSYKNGDAVSIQVVFSEAVDVTGTPQLTLETGGSDAVVDYTSGTGTATLTFNYNVAGTHTATDLDYASTTALAGGTIKKAGGATPANLVLPTPGAINSLGANKNIVIDNTASTVTNVTSSTVNGSYNANDVISVQVVFSEIVTVTGTPRLTLETGTSDAVVDYSSGSGTTTLTFNYTVASGHTATDLDYINTSALELNSGTIKDAAGNAATLTLVVPGAAGSLSANKAIVVDTTSPAVTNITSSAPDGTYSNGQTISIQMVFSEIVTVTGTPLLTLETGTPDAVVNYTSGTGTNTLTFDYTVVSGHTASDLDYLNMSALALNSGTIIDAAGNAATLTLAAPGTAGSLGANKNIVIDGVAPMVLNVTSSTANDYYKTGQIIYVDVVFNDIVIVDTTNGIPDITLETGIADGTASYTSGSGTNTLTFSYSVSGGENSTDLDYKNTSALALNLGTIKDGSGNDADIVLPTVAGIGSLSFNKNLVIDTTVPVITGVTSSTVNGTYGVGQTIYVDIVYNESVIVVGTPQIALETGSTDVIVNYSSGSGTSTITFAYTITSGHSAADLDYKATNSLVLNGGMIHDIAQNYADLTLPSPGNTGSLSSSKNLVVDGTIPAVLNVTSSTANGSYNTPDVISIQVVFSQAVNVSGTPQLTLETGGTDAVVNYSSGSGTATLTFSYIVASGHTASDLDYLSTSALALNGGSITKTAGAANAANLTLSSPGAAGSLGANKAIAIDTAIPTVTNVTSSTINGAYGLGQVIPVQVVFSEAVTVTGTPQLTLETGTTDVVVNYSSGSGSATLTFDYTVVSGNASGDLDYASTTALALNGGSINDVAGNASALTLVAPGAAGSLGANKSIVINTSVPSITSVTSSALNGSYNNGDILSIQVVFSEAVDVTGTPQLTMETGTTDAVLTYASGTGTGTLTFNYTVSGAASHTSSDLDYASTAALALNGGTILQTAAPYSAANIVLPTVGGIGSLSFNKNLVIDTTQPVVSSITSSTANGTYGVGQIIPVQVVFSEAVTVTGTPQLTLETGGTDAVISYTSGSGTATLTFNYTVASGDTSSDLDYVSTSSLVFNSGTISDAAGNAATLTLASPGAAGSLGANKTIVINTTPMTIAFTATASNGLESVTSVNLEITLSTISGSNVTVNYTVNGSSTAAGSGSDYTLAAGTATVLAGSTTTNISIPIVNDAMDENNETIIVDLSSPSGASLGANYSHTYTINDDDDPPTVSFAAATSATVNESATAYNIAVSLSAASGKSVQVTLSTTGGSATGGGTDYTLTGGTPQTLTFNPGVTSQNITITPVQDVSDEGAGETAIFGLSAPSNATLGAINTHTATITDDDGTPTLSIQDVSYNESNCATGATVTVNMAGTSASTVTVNYSSSHGTADGSDYTSASGSLTWVAGQTGGKTFSVPITCDTVAETNETVQLTISGATNASIVDASGVLTILNDDTTLTISSAETLDVDPVDGYIDHVKVTFSTNVTDSTFDGYVANSEGSTTSKWSVAGYTNVRLDHGTAYLTGSVDTANDNVIYLKFNQGSSIDTGSIPEITASADTLSAANGSGRLYYNTGNVATTDLIETDSAKPYIWYAFATNVGGSNGSAGTGDTLEIRYTESTNAANLAGVDLDTIISLNNTHDLGLAGDITSAVWSNTNFTNDTLTIKFANDAPTVYDGDTVKATGTTVQDLNGNSPAATTSVASPPVIAGTFDTGAVGPSILSAEYMDTNSNGYIDHVKVVFDKNIDDSTFPGYVGTNQVNNVTVAWKVSGYNNVALDTSDTLDTGDNDKTIYLQFSEGSVYDTGAKPDLTANTGAAALRDDVDACYINTNATNCLNSAQAVVNTTHVVEGDSAVPVVTLATARVGEKFIFVRFSENVWSAQNMPSCGAGGQLVAADFAYNNVISGGATAVENYDTDNCATTDGFVRLLADAAFAAGDISKDQVGAASDQIYDAANNAMLSTQKATIELTVAPYLVTASSYYNSTTLQYYIRLVYSEAMEFTGATTAANYTITEDTSTACANIAVNPLSINAISTTVFDLQTSAQCGTGDVNSTVYRVSVSSNVMDFNEIEPIGTPNVATTTGTSVSDKTKPRLVQALSLSPNTIQITFSEPMKTGDVLGSAECKSTYTTAATCSADIDAISGTQFKYTITPSLGAVVSVETTADPSVFVITHADNQIGSFYTITAYADNAVTNIPEDKYGSPANDMAFSPENKITFKGSGAAINEFGDGDLFDDPFADKTDFSYAFEYCNRIYLGPNDINAGAFRFEADGTNPVTVTYWTVGTTCASGTGTFGYGSAPATCNVDLGPNGERGIVGFNSGIVTLGSIDYSILMVGPLKDGVGYTYFTQDIDTELDWKPASFSATGGGNTKSVQTSYAFGNSYYAGLSSAHGTQSPILVRQQLADANIDGVLELSGTGDDLSIRSLSGIGKGGSNPAADAAAVVGVDSMIYIPVGGSPTPTNTFYIANNGGVARSTGAPTVVGSFSTFMLQSYLGGTTLVLPDQPAGLEKIRPGQKGIPALVVYKGVLYMARNLAVSQTATTETVNNGAELWKCTANCTTNSNWTRVAQSTSFNYTGGSGLAANNKAISFLQVNGDALYLGFDNPTDGVTIWKATAEITSAVSFTQQDVAGVGAGNAYPYIFSSASLKKLGKNYIYITVGDDLNAIKVVRQIDY